MRVAVGSDGWLLLPVAFSLVHPTSLPSPAWGQNLSLRIEMRRVVPAPQPFTWHLAVKDTRLLILLEPMATLGCFSICYQMTVGHLVISWEINLDKSSSSLALVSMSENGVIQDSPVWLPSFPLANVPEKGQIWRRKGTWFPVRLFLKDFCPQSPFTLSTL